MSFRVFIFFAFAFSFLQHTSLASETQQSIEWFEQFFAKDSKKSIEKDIAMAEARIQEAIESHDLLAEAREKKALAMLHIIGTKNYDKASDLLIEVLDLEDSVKAGHERVFTAMAFATLFEEVGDLTKSEEFLAKAMTINESYKDNRVLVFILNNLGRINATLGKLDKASEHYDLVLNYLSDAEEPEMKAQALFNLAHLQNLKGDLQKSLEYHKEALAIRREIRDKNAEAHSLNDIAEVYRLMKNFDKALANDVVALEIRKTLKDSKGIAESYNHIGVLYYEQNNLERAIANLQLSLESARESNDQNQIGKSYEYLSFCFKDLGDYKKALEYKELFFAITEFIQNEKNAQKLLTTQSQYDIGKVENKVAQVEAVKLLREKEIQEQKKFRDVLIALIGLGLIIVVLVLYLYVSKRRSNRELKTVNAKVQNQNRELQELNATKDKFFSIISHDLKGPLNSLTSFSGLLINHADSLSKEEIQMLAKDLDKSLKNLFSLLENLLEWSRSQTGNIEFTPETFDIKAILDLNVNLLQTQAQNKKISLLQPGTETVLVTAHKHSVNTVVRNLISNAIKFTPAGGKISLGISGDKEAVTISIQDTGVGMPKEVVDKLFRIDTKHSTKGTADEKGTGLGLILCKEFIEKNGGKIWVESTPGKGSVFSFSLPAVVTVSENSVA
jgi:signal transduction histidine kinase